MYRRKRFPAQKNTLDTYLQNKTDSVYLKIVEQQIQQDCEEEEQSQFLVNDLIPAPHDDLKEAFETLNRKYAKLEAENKKLKEDNKVLKKLLKKSDRVNMLKDYELQMKKTCDESSDKMLFIEFEGIFSQNEIKNLRSIKKGKAKDSTFVSKLVEYL